MEQYLIGIAVLLLSLTAGTFLLAKAKKEELGIFYKVIAWFVIVFSILMICCSALHCIVCRAMRMENRFRQCEMMGGMQSEMMGGMPFMMHQHENFREMHGGRDGYGECRDGHKDGKEGCMDGKEDCMEGKEGRMGGKEGHKDGKNGCSMDGKKDDSPKDGNSIKK